MTASHAALRDDPARLTAITAHHRSLLVEAGAGSGKTAVMAGRIAAMLAAGVAPRAIAAVTFTELAASELLVRVREFVHALEGGQVPAELRIAFPAGLSEVEKAHLATAAETLDEITCSTIHGFCQRLIQPYPVEANIDPGAVVMDRGMGDLAFSELTDAWLRERLSGADGGIIAELVLQDANGSVTLIGKIAEQLRTRRTVSAPPTDVLVPKLAAFAEAVDGFTRFIDTAPAYEADTVAWARLFGDLADAVDEIDEAEADKVLVRLLTTKPPAALCNKDGDFLVFKKQGKWETAAKEAGLPKADGVRLNAEARGHHDACRARWLELHQTVAGHVLARLICAVRPLVDRFCDYKRTAAFLDFDDLIFTARNLLRDHPAVRHELAARYTHVLVDEFQDTDPLQSEIFWRLCGDPPSDAPDTDWSAFQIRPGALFLVGDPKQAIYRFRGADVGAYVEARTAFRALDAGSVLSISTNFRSCAPILDYVNARFEAVLSGEGQPGFTALDAFHAEREARLSVAAFDVVVDQPEGKGLADRVRDAEAEAVAEICARLIGSEPVADRRASGDRPCRPGDIALLAPTGTDLWRYEAALERRGVPVATQAGKGFFRRQEIQDLVALTRVLADRRDRLALAALLRGPVVGLTEQELLDLVWALPRSPDAPDALPRLDLSVDAEAIAHPVARAVILDLQCLARRARSTTPYDLLSQAVDVLRLRPILRARHGGQAERALANVDLYFSLSQAYAVRGLAAFAAAMTKSWDDEEGAVEGRPDAQEEAVALYTMHAAKGLEWPIVIPINTATGVMGVDGTVTNRETNTLSCPILGVAPAGHEAVRTEEATELAHERVRVWYVAATRARQLLLLPQLEPRPGNGAWISILDLGLETLPTLELEHPLLDPDEVAAPAGNMQTRERFQAEAATIAASLRRLTWRAPSRDESAAGLLLAPEAPTVWTATELVPGADTLPPPAIQGGRERGLILHKLLEEVLTGETGDDLAALTRRAAELLTQTGRTPSQDPSTGLSADELAGCVVRTLAIEEIATLRSTLQPEFSVYASTVVDDVEQATAGIADAVSFTPDGAMDVVIDWKSDVRPNAQTLAHYQDQVRTYLDMTGAQRGLIVLVTTGQVIEVAPSKRKPV